MAHLTASEARAIATALWGKVNHTYKTNTIGAFCFSCEGHGGFIVASESIPQDKRQFVDRYISKETGTRYIDKARNKTCFMHPYRIRNGRRGFWNHSEEVSFYVFEEHCDYAIAVLAGINLTKHPIDENNAKTTFWNWYDETNPVVKNRELVKQKRQNNDPDLIISASGEWKTGIDGVTEVITADNKKHLVKGYDKASDKYGEKYLSLCEIYNPISA